MVAVVEFVAVATVADAVLRSATLGDVVVDTVMVAVATVAESVVDTATVVVGTAAESVVDAVTVAAGTVAEIAIVARNDDLDMEESGSSLCDLQQRWTRS